MESTRVIARSFASGEIAPELVGRQDLQRYDTALALCDNWIPTPRGSIYRRQGSTVAGYAENQTESDTVRLWPFIVSDRVAYILEIGPGYINVYFDGARVLNVGVPVRLTTPYISSNIPDLVFTQDHDVVTITHEDHPVHELTRVSATEFAFEPVVFAPAISPPPYCAAVAFDNNGQANANDGNPITHEYVATRYDVESDQESLPTSPGSALQDLTVVGSTVRLTTGSGASPGVRYRFYKKEAGLYGYIGQSENGTFDDNNITPDLGISPPEYAARFLTGGAYPSTVTYYAQRKVFGGSVQQPSTVWMTRTGTDRDMTFSVPTKATDSLSYTLASRKATDIRHMVDFEDLYILTSGAIWRSRSTDQGIVAADTLEFKPVATVGASIVEPISVKNGVVFIGARDQRPYLLSPGSDVLIRDLGMLAPHYFIGHRIVSSAYIESPDPIVLLLRDDGVLLGMSYLPEENVQGWFKITREYGIESIAAVPDGQSDALYLVGYINGRRTIERMRFGFDPDQAGPRNMLDGMIEYNGERVVSIAGLTAYANRPVLVFIDNQQSPYLLTVDGTGRLTLPNNVSAAQAYIGTLAPAKARLLPPVIQSPEGGVSMLKNVDQVWLRLYRSAGLVVRTSETTPGQNLLANTAMDEPAVGAEFDVIDGLFTGLRNLPLEDRWNAEGSITIESTEPLPAMITSVVIEMSVSE